MKIITICGSLKFQSKMMEIAEILSKEGNCVITPIYPYKLKSDDYSEKEMNDIKKSHFEKIKLSDSIFVVNVDNYIGESTKKEIEYAKSLNKEIIYYE